MFMFNWRPHAANGRVLCASWGGDGPPCLTHSAAAHTRAERADTRQEVKTDTETEADEVKDERSWVKAGKMSTWRALRAAVYCAMCRNAGHLDLLRCRRTWTHTRTKFLTSTEVCSTCNFSRLASIPAQRAPVGIFNARCSVGTKRNLTSKPVQVSRFGTKWNVTSTSCSFSQFSGEPQNLIC